MDLDNEYTEKSKNAENELYEIILVLASENKIDKETYLQMNRLVRDSVSAVYFFKGACDQLDALVEKQCKKLFELGVYNV